MALVARAVQVWLGAALRQQWRRLFCAEGVEPPLPGSRSPHESAWPSIVCITFAAVSTNLVFQSVSTCRPSSIVLWFWPQIVPPIVWKYDQNRPYPKMNTLVNFLFLVLKKIPKLADTLSEFWQLCLNSDTLSEFQKEEKERTKKGVLTKAVILGWKSFWSFFCLNPTGSRFCLRFNLGPSLATNQRIIKVALFCSLKWLNLLYKHQQQSSWFTV